MRNNSVAENTERCLEKGFADHLENRENRENLPAHAVRKNPNGKRQIMKRIEILGLTLSLALLPSLAFSQQQRITPDAAIFNAARGAI
jgi:hypothetical protein